MKRFLRNKMIKVIFLLCDKRKMLFLKLRRIQKVNFEITVVFYFLNTKQFILNTTYFKFYFLDEPIVPYLCEIIDKSDKTIDDAPTPFQCTKCTKKFTRVQLLKQHQMVHSDEKPFACNECPKRFKKASHLKTHKLTHALDESPHKCTQCDKIFTQDASLKLHMQKHRGNGKKKNIYYSTQIF